MKKLIANLKEKFGFSGEDADSVKSIDAIQEQPVHQEKKRHSPLPKAAVKREEIIGFIINSLKPYVDEKREVITGLRLYLLSKTDDEEATIKVALYANDPGLFKLEKLQRKLANNFISLADEWFFDFELVRVKVPDCRFSSYNYGLDVFINGNAGNNKQIHAGLRTISGQTEMAEYLLEPSLKKQYFIGRGKHPQLSSGKMHTNDIAFLNKDDQGFDEVQGKSNLFVSRSHAYISFNTSLNTFFLYADRSNAEHANKTKLFKHGNKIEAVNIPGVGHELSDGDQIELGGEAKLLFFIIH